MTLDELQEHHDEKAEPVVSQLALIPLREIGRQMRDRKSDIPVATPYQLTILRAGNCCRCGMQVVVIDFPNFVYYSCEQHDDHKFIDTSARLTGVV